MLEKTEGPIKNGQSRDVGNAGHTRHKIKIKIVYFPKHKTKTNKTKNTT